MMPNMPRGNPFERAARRAVQPQGQDDGYDTDDQPLPMPGMSREQAPAAPRMPAMGAVRATQGGMLPGLPPTTEELSAMTGNAVPHWSKAGGGAPAMMGAPMAAPTDALAGAFDAAPGQFSAPPDFYQSAMLRGLRRAAGR